jgi:carotenoid cleavage dioxygenase-like enzyme
VDGDAVEVGAQVRWFASPEPFYVVHPMHAWDEGDDVVIIAPLGAALRAGKQEADVDPEQVILGAAKP